MPMPSHESLEKEYLDASTDMRHYGNMRFAQPTLMLAANGGLVASLIGHEKPPPDKISLLLEFPNIVTAVVFYCMEQYSGIPPRGWFRATYAVRLFYVVIGVFWLGVSNLTHL